MLGEVIHGYRIDQALSADKGGFGDVYFATHVDSGAEAVVKVLKPEMSVQRDIVARFFNEARAAASVHHPGVVQIHNVGYHGDRAYLLMERLRGDDLENRLAAGPLPVERAIISPKAQRTGRRQNPPTTPAELAPPAAPAAPAQVTTGASQAEIAARRNEEGKELMYAGRYGEAARKFQDAVARVPEAKYFFNLCNAWLQEGKFDAALSACNAVAVNNPTRNSSPRRPG